MDHATPLDAAAGGHYRSDTAADGDDDPPDIVVQQSAALSGPPATLDGSAFDDLFPSTLPSARPAAGTRITVTGYWNPPTATGWRLRVEGGPLPAGASYSFGFQAATDKPGEVNPTGCTINGIPCAGF